MSTTRSPRLGLAPRSVALLTALIAVLGCGKNGDAPGRDAALAAAVDAYLAPLIERHDLSGVILIGGREDVRYRRAFGNADEAAGIPNTPDTRFAIASLTKTFTAGATLIALEHGQLRLEDTLDRFGLGFPRAGDITVRDLLVHSSGLSNPDYREALDTRIDLVQLVERIVARPLQFEPGSEHRYSNAGFNVLARVIELASGRSYDAFLAEHVFGPLGLRATGHVDRMAADVALGYVPAPGPAWRERVPALDPSFSIGSGSLHSTADDLLLWARAVGAERLYTWREREWPYGWGRVKTGDQEGIEQTGGTPGYMSSLLVYPDAEVYIVVLLNQEYGGWVSLGRDLAAIAIGAPYAPIPRIEPVLLAAERLGRYVGRYADGEGSVRIVDRDGHLWLYSGDWPVGKYLTPVAPAEFAVRSDVGRVRFEDAGDAGFGLLRWDFGGSDRELRRAD